MERGERGWPGGTGDAWCKIQHPQTFGLHLRSLAHIFVCTYAVQVEKGERLCIRLSLEEMEELRGLAARARLSVSELIRQWIRLGELPVRTSARE